MEYQEGKLPPVLAPVLGGSGWPRPRGRVREHAEDKLTETIIQCIIKVHQTLGPGFLESVYRRPYL